VGVDAITHDSYQSFYRTPFGAVPCGQEITLRTKVLAWEPVRVTLKLMGEGWQEDIAMELMQESEAEKSRPAPRYG